MRHADGPDFHYVVTALQPRREQRWKLYVTENETKEARDVWLLQCDCPEDWPDSTIGLEPSKAIRAASTRFITTLPFTG